MRGGACCHLCIVNNGLSICPSRGTVGTSMPRATHGIFVNFEDDGTSLFCGMQRRGERTAFSFARTVLPDLHRTAIHIHVGPVAALVLPGEEYSLKVYGGPWGFACSEQH